MKFRDIGAGTVVDGDAVIVALDWRNAKNSVGYARAHGFLVETSEEPKIMLLTSDQVMLLPGPLRSLKRRLEQT
jgi:hypothetical protein